MIKSRHDTLSVNFLLEAYLLEVNNNEKETSLLAQYFVTEEHLIIFV